MKLLICADKFKGSLTAEQVVEALAWACHRLGIEADALALADGGDGFLDSLSDLRGATLGKVPARDALGREKDAPWLALGPTAYLELAQICGLAELAPEDRQPEKRSSYGLGQALAALDRRGFATIVAGLGGSASHDLGMGMASALGFRFLDRQGRALEPLGENLGLVETIRPPARPLRARVVAATDVRSPLLGPKGAARLFAPQKGATPETVERLEAGSRRIAQIWAQQSGIDHGLTPGAGAAGGIGWAMASFLDAPLRSGFDLLADAFALRDRLQKADALIATEGQLDRSSFEGKLVGRLWEWASAMGKPMAVICGQALAGAAPQGMAVLSLSERFGLKASLGRPAELLPEALSALLKGGFPPRT